MYPTIILLNTLEYCSNKLRPIIYKTIKNELNIPNVSNIRTITIKSKGCIMNILN